MKTKASTGEERDDVLAPLRLAVERASSEAQYAERRYMAVDPDNRLIARTLEADWEKALRKLETAKAELALCEQQRPRTPRDGDRKLNQPLGSPPSRGVRHNDAERGGDAISCRRWPYAVSAGVQLKMCKKPPAIGAPTGWLTQSVSVQPFKRIDENRADRSLTPARLVGWDRHHPS